MTNFADILGQQIGSQAAGGIMGIMFGSLNDQRQYRQQQKLQDLQIQGQKQMTDYNMSKQLQMWLDTNYPAQVEQMKKAGINPALLYGMSGGGATTTGNASGNVTGAQAPQGGREIQDMTGMGIQMPLIAAQIEKTKAETANINADTQNKPIQGKNIETQTMSLAQGIENQKAAKELMEVETDIKRIEDFIKGKTQNMAIAIISNQLQESQERLQLIKNQHKLSDATLKDQIDKIKGEMLGQFVHNALMESQTNLTNEQRTLTEYQGRYNVIGGYYQRWKEISNSSQNAQTAADRLQNEIVNETGLPPDVIEKAVQAIILKDLFKPSTPTRNPVGYGR